MSKIDYDNVIDFGIFCCDCDKHYWYDVIKDAHCPEGHYIGFKKEEVE